MVTAKNAGPRLSMRGPKLLLRFATLLISSRDTGPGKALEFENFPPTWSFLKGIFLELPQRLRLDAAVSWGIF